jgi:hypothetical protein
MSTCISSPILPPTRRTRMAIELVMEVVRQPTLTHVVEVLRVADYRALLLMRCHNPDIRAFWRTEPRQDVIRAWYDRSERVA